MKSMIKNHLEKSLCIEGAIRSELIMILEDCIKKNEVTSLFVKAYLNCLLPERLDYLEIES